MKLYLRGETRNSQRLIYHEFLGMCSKGDRFIRNFHCPPDQPEDNQLVFDIIPNRYLKASMYVGSMARN